jgi:dihydrofolate reductase
VAWTAAATAVVTAADAKPAITVERRSELAWVPWVEAVMDGVVTDIVLVLVGSAAPHGPLLPPSTNPTAGIDNGHREIHVEIAAPVRSRCTKPGNRRNRPEGERPMHTNRDTGSATVLYMSMSLDGFIAGPNEGPGNGLGDGGVHEWVFPGADANNPGAGRPAGVNGTVVDEFMATGAVVAGRGTFEPAGGWGGDHHDGVPIFVLTRREPDSDTEHWPLVTYASDVRTAMTQAKQAAGDKNVLVHGAGTAQLALTAGVLDELEIHLIPVLFGQGRRLFDDLAPEHIELERTRILEGRPVSPTCTTGCGADVSMLPRADLHPPQLPLVAQDVDGSAPSPPTAPR